MNGDTVVSFPDASARASGAAAATVAVLALAAAVSPVAFAGPVTEVHDFATGPQGWFSYPPEAVTTSAETGELCSAVGAHTGNPWDVAVQHDAVTFDRDATYVVEFDAHASRAVTVPVQGGPGYPAAFGGSVELDGSATPEHVELTFSPSAWPTGEGSPVADDWTTTTGNVSFQLGNQGEPYELCIDDLSITPLGTNLIPNGDFASGTTDPWFVAGDLGTADVSSGALVVPVPAGSGIYAGVGFNGLAIEEGTSYTLTFDVSASEERTIRAIVGENGGSYGTVLDRTVPVTTEPTTVSHTFTATDSYPATTTPGGPFEGQLAFQVGGRGGDWTFTLDDVSLVESLTPPPPYEPETGPRVRVNQVGYLPAGPKQATLVTDATEPVVWQVRTVSGGVLAEGDTVPAGVEPSSGLNVHTIDFGALTTEHEGLVLTADGETSRPFDIDPDLYQQLRYDALNFFYLMRSGVEIDASINADYARPAGHVDVAPNQGDGAVTCLTAADEGAGWAYGDWTCPEGYALDVRGGWYDAGDHGKYVVNGGIAAAQLLSTYERSLHAGTAEPGALADGTLAVPESANGVPDVLDEARWELEFLLSMQVPADGGEYAGMAHHKIHDVGWTGLPLLPSQDPQERRLARPSTAATLNLAAAAAQGARLFADHDPDFAAELLDAARTAWDAAQAHPAVLAPDAAGNNGGGAYSDGTVTDEFYWAAAELFLTTGEDAFAEHVLASPHATGDVFGPGGMNWGSTAGLGRLDLATVPNDLPSRDAIRQSVIDAADAYVATQDAQAWGSTYVRPDGLYEWGSNSMVLNTTVVVATAFDLTGDETYRRSALEAVDYLLGRNALNMSYVSGYGEVSAQHQHNRWFPLSVPGVSPDGSLAGGPNSTTGTWDPTMQAAFAGGCAPSMCYLDELGSWASNEVAINWNSVLSWVASFVADQGDGSADASTPVRVTQQPADATVAPGASATFTAAADGVPAPTVRWQVQRPGARWADVPGATSTTLTVTAALADHGTLYRAVFTNASGSEATDVARLAVVATERLAVRLSSPALRAGGHVTVAVRGAAAREVVQVRLGDELLETRAVRKDGTVSISVHVPRHTDPGAYTVTVRGTSSGREGSATLQVLPAPRRS